MVDEGVVFEGLRLGSTQAFEELLAADDAAMRRLARLYVSDEQVAPLVRQAWSVALPGLDMFTWHTTLRAWLAGILVTYGRARRAPRSPGPVPGTTTRTGEPLPWSSLAWSSLWGPESWGALEAALAARPLPEQEVLWLHDVEGWPRREVLDTLGLVAEEGEELLHRGRSALAAAVAAHVGRAPGPTADEQRRLEGVATLLSALRPRQPEPAADPRLRRTFLTWRRQRGVRAWRRWRWELVRAWRRPAQDGSPG